VEQGSEVRITAEDVQLLQMTIAQHLEQTVPESYVLMESRKWADKEKYRAIAYLMGQEMAAFADAEDEDQAKGMALLRLLEFIVEDFPIAERDERPDRSPQPHRSTEPLITLEQSPM